MGVGQLADTWTPLTVSLFPFPFVIHRAKEITKVFYKVLFYYGYLNTAMHVYGVCKLVLISVPLYRVINQNWDASELGHLVLGEYKGYELQTWTDL